MDGIARLPKLPIALDEHRFDLYADAPAIGEQTASLLRAFGYTAQEIQSLHDAGIIVAAPDNQPFGARSVI